MRFFLQRQNRPQERASSSLARSNTTPSPPRPRLHPLLHVQRAAGNHAVQRQLRNEAIDKEPDKTKAPPVVHEVLRSSGQPLDPSTRASMEQRFGHDLSRVNVHTDARAAASARAVRASAYTVGNHIVFGQGRYAVATSAGRQLLAHELAHVIQQREITSPPQDLSIAPASGAAERQAESMTRAASEGTDARRRTGSPPAKSVAGSLQRQEEPAAPSAPTAEDDWDFTVDDYRALRQRGEHLRFAPDSAWLPTPVRENILATLNYLYETTDRPALHMHAGGRAQGESSTAVIPFTGVSARDLYHAHVVVERAAMLDPSRRALQNRLVEARRRYDAVLGGGPVTDANRAAYTAGVQAAEREATPLLESVVRADQHGDLVFALPGAAMIYHTLEVAAGEMGIRPGDPRRNILTRFDELTPRLYTPLNPDSSHFRHEFDQVMVLSFLVDAAGLIHAHPGGLQEQSLTTGRNEGGVERLLEHFAPRGVPEARPTPAPQPSPPELGIGRARRSSLVYVDNPARPTRWSNVMLPGLMDARQSWHEPGRPLNFVLVDNQRFFLHQDGRVAP